MHNFLKNGSTCRILWDSYVRISSWWVSSYLIGMLRKNFLSFSFSFSFPHFSTARVLFSLSIVISRICSRKHLRESERTSSSSVAHFELPEFLLLSMKLEQTWKTQRAPLEKLTCFFFFFFLVILINNKLIPATIS